MRYEVIVGNIGTVYNGPDSKKANEAFNEYKQQSLTGYGRASHEPVTLMVDGEPSKEFNGYPDCYIQIEECRSGEKWILPIKGNQTLNLKTRIKSWIKAHFGEGWLLDGDIMPKLQGDYYGAIYTDNRPPDGVCWDAGGFYVKCVTG